MKEFMLYVETLKRIADIHYGKECLFYNDGEWYSRDHSRKLSPEEACEYVLKIVYSYENEDEYTDMIVCPNCSESVDDTPYLFQVGEDEIDIDCQYCNERMRVEVKSVPRYSSYKIDKGNI